MIINRKPALSLNQALANKDLKIKHITGENYQKILFLKRKLRNSIDALVEDEVQLAKDIGYDPSNTETHKDFTDKLSVIQSAFKVEIYDPFLTIEEFKHFVEALDIESASLVAEFLLKEFSE
jgi:hypothetical protein